VAREHGAAIRIDLDLVDDRAEARALKAEIHAAHASKEASNGEHHARPAFTRRCMARVSSLCRARKADRSPACRRFIAPSSAPIRAIASRCARVMNGRPRRVSGSRSVTRAP